MTNNCQFKRGFFTLRACNRLAVKQCEQCGKPSCQSHLSTSSGMRICVDCDQSGQYYDNYSDDWVYSYRNNYYRRGYQPFMYTHHDYNSFDRYDGDYDDFDNESDGGDFSDS